MISNIPLVSIITITYNRADLIHRCIESIQKQTYLNYEHIIVDGASTDNTERVVKSYNDIHIKYIKLKNRGPQIQMKAGSNLAQGKYVTFLDDDDEYLPSKIEKQVALFETLPEEYGIVYCWMTYYNFNEPDKIIRIHKTELKGFVGDIAPSKPLITGTPTILLRRSVFEKFGGTFNDSIGYLMSDWELCARICQKYKVDYVPESLVRVYINHGHARLTNNFYSDKAKKGILFHTHFLNEFKYVFERHPEYANLHYFNLSRNYAKLKQRNKAFKYHKLMCRTKPKLIEYLKSFIGILLSK